MTKATQFDFDRDGCLLAKGALDPNDLEPLIQHIGSEVGQFAEGLK